MTKDELIKEMKYSFPSPRIIDVANDVTVFAGGEHFKLKRRSEEESNDDIFVTEFNFDYMSESGLGAVEQKNIVVPIEILHHRAKRAFESYLQSLKSGIKMKMVEELSGLGYGYQEIVKGCFDTTQRYSSLMVPKEHLKEIKEECVDEVTLALKAL